MPISVGMALCGHTCQNELKQSDESNPTLLQ